eukprot:gnl/MRDRNA2_/MRDRNA2_138496_c0_seq1.p1 gnl/MRDRNA2_/MRDRNA2_138496_c0~~gnl/MRDRNA2_/MRDRNA2_138496_c0_seq1.p1  ORF type:complete len:105 (+),score=9.06 gnl/MRDRNA2_/MRDRNA2_138496_c0_seq1:43-357(+)
MGNICPCDGFTTEGSGEAQVSPIDQLLVVSYDAVSQPENPSPITNQGLEENMDRSTTDYNAFGEQRYGGGRQACSLMQQKLLKSRVLGITKFSVSRTRLHCRGV